MCKFKIESLVVSVAVSLLIPSLCCAREALRIEGKAIEDQRWQVVKRNISKFINMPEDELQKTLGSPCSQGDAMIYRFLHYRLDGLDIWFTVIGQRVSSINFEPYLEYKFPHREKSGPHFEEASRPQIDRDTNSNRWKIVRSELNRFVGMPLEKLLYLLGPPDAKYCGNEILIYDLGNRTDIHFSCKNMSGESVERFSFEFHPEQHFVIPNEGK